MSFSKEAVYEVQKAYEQKALAVQTNLQERITIATQKIPELSLILNELKTTGAQIFGATLSGNVSDQFATIRSKNLELQEKERNLLKENGLPSDYLLPQYECQNCKDTGYVGYQLCPCMRKAIVEKQMEFSGFGKLLQTQSFDNFSLDFYQGNAKEQMKNNVALLSDFADRFATEKKNFLLYGKTGLGKTHLCTACAKKLLENGYYVVYETAQDFCNAMNQATFHPEDDGAYQNAKKYETCDLLILDDLGTEVVTKNTISYLYQIINHRLCQKLPMLINTNLNGTELTQTYQDRIVSRIFGEFTVLVFDGKDVRQQKLQK